VTGAPARDVWLAGVDGCRDGWIVAFVRPAGRQAHFHVVKNFVDIFARPEMPMLVAVDMPIGLPEHSQERGRKAEREARERVGSRRSSVFRVPSRTAIEVGSNRDAIPDDRTRYAKACEIARATSVDEKAFSKQSFYLFEKIVEVDQVLRGRPELISCVYEIHPELAFWRLNGEKPLPEPKKTKIGLARRQRLLVAAGFSAAVVNGMPPKGAGRDDLLDALACAAIARRIHAGLARPFPDPREFDGLGLPMAIWA
jgi:predicted RNase H-like nuclease